MSQPRSALAEQLTANGLTIRNDREIPDPESPWFVKALLALAGWVAAIFIMGFIGLGFITLIKSSAASLTLGLVMIGGAYLLLRIPKNDFVEHMALAISLAGQLLVAWAIGSALDQIDAGLWWSLVILQGTLAVIMPNFVHRVFSSFAAILAFSLAMGESGAGPVTGGLILWPIAWIWMHEFDYPNKLRFMQALGYGLVLSLLTIQYLMRTNLMSWHSDTDAWAQPWMGELFAGVAIVYVFWRLFQRTNPIQKSIQWAAYTSVAVLFLASLQAYGLTQGMVILVLGFAIGNRLLMGLGAISLLFSISSYYYLLDVTLLTKAQTLLALGVLLLLTRWLMLRFLPHKQEPDHG